MKLNWMGKMFGIGVGMWAAGKVLENLLEPEESEEELRERLRQAKARMDEANGDDD